MTSAGAQDPVVKTHCSDTGAFGHGSLRMHSTKPHSDEALYESPSSVFQLQLVFRVLLLNYEYICLDTFILCTLQAKSKHHICIFLHYAFIDPDNIFQYCIFDGWSYVISLL